LAAHFHNPLYADVRSTTERGVKTAASAGAGGSSFEFYAAFMSRLPHLSRIYMGD
jgi:hypothetical protein